MSKKHLIIWTRESGWPSTINTQHQGKEGADSPWTKATYVINCALSCFFWVSSLRLQLRNDQRVEYGFSETSHKFL